MRSNLAGHRRPRALVAVGGVVLLLASGCVTTAEQGRRMRHDIDTLQGRVDGLRRDVESQKSDMANVQATLQKVDGRLDAIEKTLQSVGFRAQKNDANFGATVDQVQGEIQTLKGTLEELRHDIDQVTQGQTDYQQKVDQQLASLKGAQAAKAFQAKQEAKKLATPTEPGPFLELARQKVKAKQYDVAQNLLKQFLKKWPKDKGAAEAQLLLADTYFAQQAWRPAILEYNRFREHHPKDRAMPRALLRIGEAFARIDLKPEAGKFFDALIHRYPHSKEARQARHLKRGLRGK